MLAVFMNEGRRFALKFVSGMSIEALEKKFNVRGHTLILAYNGLYGNFDLGDRHWDIMNAEKVGVGFILEIEEV